MVPLACINAGQYWKGQDRQFHKDMSLLTTRRDAAQPHETTAWRFASVKERSTVMSGKTDQIKRRIKEAAGAYPFWWRWRARVQRVQQVRPE